ncbi:hypothetical protein EON63_19390 [archaeon]|nr:MAG: hypothetical protein EON63_19390 [archaeon]
MFVLITAADNLEHQSISSIEDFEYDENHRLKHHQLLYYGNEDCEEEFNDASFERREVRRLEDPLLHQYLASSNKNNTQTTCFLICLERGVHYNHILHPLLDQVLVRNDASLTAEQAQQSVPEWIQSHCQAKEVGFISYLPFTASIYWVNPKGKRIMVGTLPPGERNTVWMGSYLGHKFVLTNPATEEVVGEIIIEFHTLYSIGEQISARRHREVRHLVQNTFESEWQRAHRVTRTFTPFGFSRGKLPKDLFGSMSAYYYNNRDQATMEEWESKGVFVNWWETDVFFVSMPMGLKVSACMGMGLNMGMGTVWCEYGMSLDKAIGMGMYVYILGSTVT